MVHMIMITEIRALSLSLCRWINLDVGQVAQAPNRPTAHVVRAMKDGYLGTHQYYGPQRASSIDTRCNHNLKMPFVPVLCVCWLLPNRTECTPPNQTSLLPNQSRWRRPPRAPCSTATSSKLCLNASHIVQLKRSNPGHHRRHH